MNTKKQEEAIELSIIRSDGQTLYQNKVYAITSHNELGTFDILPLHENFIAIINLKIVIHEFGGTKKEFDIESGILRNSRNKAEIFLGIHVDTPDNPNNTKPINPFDTLAQGLPINSPASPLNPQNNRK